MHENATVRHLSLPQTGEVRRAPAGDDRPGAFYRADTLSFYVVWTRWAGPVKPEPGWHPATQIARIVR